MSFSLTIGQKAIKRDLLQALSLSQIPHAQCIIDHGGRGGLALALDLAFSLLYTEIPDSQEKAIQHPDLQFVYPVTTSSSVKSKPNCADYINDWRSFVDSNLYGSLYDWLAQIGSENKQGNIGVEEATQIFKRLSLKAYLGKNKVCVLWGIERLNIQAANKLLKLIEEPPQNTYFIFVVPNEETLLPTIKSRCQLIKLPPVKADEIKNHLIDKKGVDENKAQEIANRSQGDLKLAFQLLESGEDTKLLEELLIGCLRSAFLAGKGEKAVSIDLMHWSNKMATLSRPIQKSFLVYGSEFIRQALLVSYQTHPLVSFKSLTGFSLEKFAPYVHSDNITSLIKLFEESSYAIERNANAKILFSDFCVQLTRLLHQKER